MGSSITRHKCNNFSHNNLQHFAPSSLSPILFYGQHQPCCFCGHDPTPFPATLTCQSPLTFTSPGPALTSTSPQPVLTQRQLPVNQLSKVSIWGAPSPLIHLLTAMDNPEIPPSSIQIPIHAMHQLHFPPRVQARLHNRILQGTSSTPPFPLLLNSGCNTNNPLVLHAHTSLLTNTSNLNQQKPC